MCAENVINCDAVEWTEAHQTASGILPYRIHTNELLFTIIVLIYYDYVENRINGQRKELHESEKARKSQKN